MPRVLKCRTVALIAVALAGLGALLAGCSWCGCCVDDAKVVTEGETGGVWYRHDGPVRTVGEVDRTRFLVAYYASTIHDEWLTDLARRRHEAIASGDKAESRRLEREGAGSQDLAHRQLAGDASIASLVDAVRSRLPGVADQAGVDAIAEAGTWCDQSVERTDVTDEVVALFTPKS